MENTILSTYGLTKIYKDKRAVSDVSITINNGDIYGFVGQNGSGKTTFMRMIASLITPTSGTFELFGENGQNSKHLKRISSMIESPAIHTNLNALDNLIVQCNVFGIKKVMQRGTAIELLELVGLNPFDNKKSKNFSLGMRQRLGIAMALVGKPEFMLLDEPTNGLDPQGIMEIRELLTKLNKEHNITILISSHILSELSKLATRYGFIHNGKILKEIDANELSSSSNSSLEIKVDDLVGATDAFTNANVTYTIVGDKIILSNSETVSDIYALLSPKNINILSSETKTIDLESYFFNLIGGAN